VKLKKATNRVAFGKVGLYGEAGSGKTRTAAEIAIGLHQANKLEKPVAMFDTEPAASYIIPLFEKAGIDFLVYDESRSLKDLMEFITQAEKDCSVAIVDSITHVWREAQTAYLKKVNERRSKKIWALEFHHWGPIKAEWARFTDQFLSSKLHMIVCGRAGKVYEYQKNEETGKMELITSGSKMAVEKELGYEPSLLIEMAKVRDTDENLLIRAFVEKDRTDTINGQFFDFPKFESFKPHFDFINIGGEHFGSMDQRSSADLYEGKTESDGWAQEKRYREINCEEIKGLFSKYGLDGQSKEAKEKRLSLIEAIFNTRSWTAIESLSSKNSREGLAELRRHFGEPEEPSSKKPEDSEVPF